MSCLATALLPILLALRASLGERQGPQAREGDLVAAADAPTVGAGLVPPDRRIDLLQELFLLLDYRQVEASLGRRAPPVGTGRVACLGLLLPLGQRPTNPSDQCLPPFYKKCQDLLRPRLTFHPVFTCHAEALSAKLREAKHLAPRTSRRSGLPTPG